MIDWTLRDVCERVFTDIDAVKPDIDTVHTDVGDDGTSTTCRVFF